MAGANRSLFALVANLPDDVTPVVVLAGEGEVARHFRKLGVDTRIASPPEVLNQFGKAVLNWSPIRQAWEVVHSLLPYSMQLRKLISELAIDVIHVNDIRGAFLTTGAARLTGCPMVGHVRGEVSVPTLHRRIFERACDRIITVADSVQKGFSAQARQKCYTVYNGINHREVVALAKNSPPVEWLQKLRDQGGVVACCFASVVPFKGIHHLLEATALLNASGCRQRVNVVVVGDQVPEHKDYQAWLHHRQKELAVDNFHYAGWQANPFPYYAVSDFTVLPSVSCEQLSFADQVIEVRGGEGLPRTHLEAMCFGLPSVGTRIAGVTEQITNGENGFVVSPANPAELADAMRRLLSNTTLRERMGEQARQRVLRQFSVEQYVNGVKAVYESLLSSQRRAA